MKTLILLICIVLFTHNSQAQVGINTTRPMSTLDVNGNVIIRDVTAVSTLSSDYSLMIRDKSTIGDNTVKEISSDLFSGKKTAYYGTKNGSWSLLNLSLGGGWQKLNLTGTSDTKMGDTSLFTDGVYTAIQPGIYSINYELQLESGINIEALGGKKLGILKNDALWEEKKLDGVRVSLLGITLASIPITSTGIQSIVSLETGDTVTFAVNTSGLLNLGLLTDSKVNVFIYKISN
jgi:hypothetical protein